MENDYMLFDFQEIVGELRQKENEEGESQCHDLLCRITGEMGMEDMPFYKEYIAKFDVDWLFGKCALRVPQETMASESDYKLLVGLVCASFSSIYELKHDGAENEVDLEISVTHGGRSISKRLDDLWSFQIYRLFANYLEEQMSLESLRMQSESEREAVDEERKMRRLVYEKKKKLIENQMLSGDILSDLEALLEK